MFNILRLGIIDRYIGRTVLIIIALVAIVLTLITGVITFIDQTRHIGKGNIDFFFLLWYIVLLLPSKFLLLFPISVLLGGVIGLGLLSKNSELVVIQGIGMSKMRIILSACKMIVPLVILVSVLGQTVVPKIEQYAESQFNYTVSEGRISRTSWGIWLRDGDSFISIRMVMSDNSIYDITRYDFDKTGLHKVAIAKTGIYENGKWDMRDVRNIVYGEKAIGISTTPLEKWQLYLTPDKLRLFNLHGADLNVNELIGYIKYLKSNNIDASRYEISLYKLFILPISMIVMLLLGASTVFGSLRSIPMSARVIIGLSLGFGFYLCNEVIPNFVLVVGIPPLIGVIAPSIIFTAVSLYLLNRRV